MQMLQIANKKDNQKGFSLIGIILVIVIIAAIGYGSLFFYKEKKAADIYRNAYDKAEEDINEINKKVEEMSELINETMEEDKEEEADKTKESAEEIIEELNIYPE